MMNTELESVVFDQPEVTLPHISNTIKNDPNDAVHALNVKEVMKNKLNAVTLDKWEADKENPFFVGDLGEVYRQHLRWQSLLPRIEPFFAVKANPDPMVIQLLASLGLGFDCASKSEIQQVLNYGIDPSRIIYANPCKQSSFIRFAAQHNVAKMTFDNAEELYKIKKLYPGAELVLRILTDDSKSLCQLGLKFGAPMETVSRLFQIAKDLHLNVVGVSFHVGSGCLDENAFYDALLRAREAFDIGESLGFDLKLLDVGGGFPGADVQDGITFEKVANVMRPALDSLFAPEIRVIAEPGRYYVASAFTVCTNVIGRRTVEQDETKFMYYVNDGMYGSFNCILFDHQVVMPKVLLKEGRLFPEALAQDKRKCSIWGPTCDSIDCLVKETRMDVLDIGDWLYWENMGAYTICAASQFNGFKQPEVLYTNTYTSNT